ncbi:MAG: FtsX-like permease family protein, partial [bacterium]|nr:FtsX-like permease family protein [bacterium]
LNPNTPFEYHFLDEEFESQYKNEQRFGKIFNYSTILAIFISALGLFGLASFTAERRTKEIGIRKTLGASVRKIILNLSREFIILVLIANIFSWPLAYYFGNMWLEGFAYRADPEIWLFLISGLTALMIALATISYHVIKASMRNPVNSLRYE